MAWPAQSPERIHPILEAVMPSCHNQFALEVHFPLSRSNDLPTGQCSQGLHLAVH